jgi:hypothetical protein
MEQSNNAYIIGNTISSSLEEVKTKHIIPVFTKDNSALISQAAFIEIMSEEITKMGYNSISSPDIRLSHPIKGRIPEACHKSKEELLPSEETLFYERMIFLYRISDITASVGGQTLSLVIGGVKAYNQDNFNKDYRGMQHFKIFMGFQVKVCSNLCIWSDGSVVDLKVNDLDTLRFHIAKMITAFRAEHIVKQIQSIQDYSITENQFAHIVGRCRLLIHGNQKLAADLSNVDITDSQVNHVVKQYFTDQNFGGNSSGIDLWSLYNLFTDGSKNAYIDKFVGRNAHASTLVQDVVDHLENRKESYFLN